MTPRRAPRRGRVFKATKKTGPASCEHCRARIVFVTMTDTGKKVPVDPIPVDDGNICARTNGNQLEGYAISKTRPAERIYTRYAAHFATCASRERPAPKPPAEPVPTLFDTPTQQGEPTA